MVDHSRLTVPLAHGRVFRNCCESPGLRFARIILLLWPLGFALVADACGESVYTLQPVEFGSQLKTPDGRVVFEYMTKKPENVGLTSPSVACFHPVNTPGGERVTALAPNDHPHHRGIFLAWQDSEFHEFPKPANPSPTSPLRTMNVSRADFWAWGVYAPRDGRVHRESLGEAGERRCERSTPSNRQ